jgi:hypothetical protein
MKNKPYSVVGNRENGFRIAVPTETGAKAGDKYDCKILRNGALMYVPRRGKKVVPK